MIALEIMLAAFASSSVSSPESAATAPRPDIEVVGPAQQNRVICRIIGISNSRIPARRVCQTQAQIEEARDRAQAESAADIRSTTRRTNEIQENSGYGIWARSHQDVQIGETDVRQTRRGGD